ncbi:MAG TPA: GNAT family N-acetyltransferase [Sumerlaeia bacterium]|nr:GNAT family N-acetyltransferase [Sumerlaeia bacterium]
MENAKLTVERARAADGPWIARAQVLMARESEGLELDPEVVGQGVRRVFDEPERGFYLVARRSGSDEPLGCALIQPEWSDWRNAEVWWIHSLYVVEPDRRQGVFRRMFEHVRAEARMAGVRGLRLIVERKNARARAVYARLGMTSEHYETFEILF